MTRKRTRENLNRVLTEPCFYCEGSGTLKSRKTVCYEIIRDIEREGSAAGGEQIVVTVHPQIDSVLKEEERDSIIELEKRVNKRIVIVSKETHHLEQYEISL
jgi:ribonuclease G